LDIRFGDVAEARIGVRIRSLAVTAAQRSTLFLVSGLLGLGGCNRSPTAPADSGPPVPMSVLYANNPASALNASIAG
jgi:hypothetical protein